MSSDMKVHPTWAAAGFRSEDQNSIVRWACDELPAGKLSTDDAQDQMRSLYEKWQSEGVPVSADAVGTFIDEARVGGVSSSDAAMCATTLAEVARTHIMYPDTSSENYVNNSLRDFGARAEELITTPERQINGSLLGRLHEAAASSGASVGQASMARMAARDLVAGCTTNSPAEGPDQRIAPDQGPSL